MLYWTTLAAGVVGLGGLAAWIVAEPVSLTSRAALAAGAWATAAAGAIATWAAVRWDRRSWSYPGVGPGAAREVAAGLGEGGALAALAAAVCWGGGVRWEMADASPGVAATSALWLLAFFSGAALFEELAFRGYPLRRALQSWPPGVALGGLGGIFAVMHLDNPGVSVLGVANIALAGVWFGAAFWRSGSLARTVGLHLGWNWVSAVGFGFGVSGFAFEGGIVNVSDAGHDWVTGGAFGPEGGVAGTVILTLGIGRWVVGARHRARPA
jgi:membrane protease YdiL (CAAX protease family)